MADMVAGRTALEMLAVLVRRLGGVAIIAEDELYDADKLMVEITRTPELPGWKVRAEVMPDQAAEAELTTDQCAGRSPGTTHCGHWYFSGKPCCHCEAPPVADPLGLRGEHL